MERSYAQSLIPTHVTVVSGVTSDLVIDQRCRTHQTDYS